MVPLFGSTERLRILPFCDRAIASLRMILVRLAVGEGVQDAKNAAAITSIQSIILVINLIEDLMPSTPSYSSHQFNCIGAG